MGERALQGPTRVEATWKRTTSVDVPRVTTGGSPCRCRPAAGAVMPVVCGIPGPGRAAVPCDGGAALWRTGVGAENAVPQPDEFFATTLNRIV